MSLLNVDDEWLLEAHESSPTDSLEETVTHALALYAELENPEEMLEDVDLERRSEVAP